jgi:hypothetical protein
MMTEYPPLMHGKREAACQLAKHLRDVDARQEGPHWSLCLYLKFKNQFCPPNDPWLGCALFGEEGCFVDNKALIGAPPDGHRFIIY